MRVLTTKVIFHGLYYWGGGWANNDVCGKWRAFWEFEFPKRKYIFWSHHSKGDSEYLIETGGSAFLHPMDFTVLLRKYGSCGTYDKNGRFVERHSEIDELKKICNDLIKYIGVGSVEFYPVKIHDLELYEESYSLDR